MNQAELGKAVGVGKAMVSKYEAGAAKVTPESLLIMSNLFTVTLDYLIIGKDFPQTPPQPPTKEDALRLVLTSDPQLVEKIKDDLRHQIQEETPTYQSRLTSNETRLLKAFSFLDARRQERLIDTAEDMSVALLRGSDQEGTGRGRNCAESNGE